MKILVADDDLLSARILKKMLDKWGKSDIANDGLEVVALFKQAREDGEPYDLICLDINMPNLDGLEALEMIRKIEAGGGHSAIVFMTTAQSTIENVTTAKTKGQCAAFLVKPIEPEAIKSTMEKAGFKFL